MPARLATSTVEFIRNGAPVGSRNDFSRARIDIHTHNCIARTLTVYFVNDKRLGSGGDAGIGVHAGGIGRSDTPIGGLAHFADGDCPV